MREIKIKCPAKINLTLEIVNKREDGFHNIKSIMQMISLYDYLTISVTDSKTDNIIELDGTSNEIPYNEKNLVYKASQIFLNEIEEKNKKIQIYIDKNIPISAGLAGGSTDAAGTLYGLNILFDNILPKEKLEELCAKLGSDLNVCLNGGCQLATSRGEITTKLKAIQSPVTLIKPKNLGISAGEAYKKYSKKEYKPQNNMTEKMINALENKENISQFLYNDLEYAVFNDYLELQNIKKAYPDSIMSGSGSTYFVLKNNVDKSKLDSEYIFIDNLEFIESGVQINKN